MSFETALLARTADSAAVQATGAAVEWARRPQGKYPAVVLTIVSDLRGRTMTGMQGTRPIRVQIDVMALTRSERIGLREAVIAAVQGSATAGGVIFSPVRDLSVTAADEDDGTDPVFRDMIEGVFWHRMEE